MSARPAAAALCALVALGAGPPAAELAERLAWNARERTATGVRELREGRPADAIGALDTALRLRPEDPVARFNAGTARIGVEPGEAAEILEPAASTAPEELAPDAWYNLGNAQLAADDPDAAVKSYVQALRRRPAHFDTKHNLELALRRAEQKEKEEQESDRQGAPKPGGDTAGGAGGEQGDAAEGSQEGEGDSTAGESERPNAGDRQQDPEAERGPQPETGDGGSDPAESPGAAPSPRDAPGPGERQGPLPRFRELPDMTAEQAAAILRAVDDLERRQRRERAQNEARLREVVEVDW